MVQLKPWQGCFEVFSKSTLISRRCRIQFNHTILMKYLKNFFPRKTQVSLSWELIHYFEQPSLFINYLVIPEGLQYVLLCSLWKHKNSIELIFPQLGNGSNLYHPLESCFPTIESFYDSQKRRSLYIFSFCSRFQRVLNIS